MRRKSAEYDVVKREEVSFRSRVCVALLWRTAFLNEADRARNKVVLADCTFRTAFRNALDELFDTPKRSAVTDLARDSAQSVSVKSHSEPNALFRWRKQPIS